MSMKLTNAMRRHDGAVEARYYANSPDPEPDPSPCECGCRRDDHPLDIGCERCRCKKFKEQKCQRRK